MFIIAALLAISLHHYNETKPYEFVPEPYICYDACA